jgi:cytochrome c oxidase subunit 2
MKTIEGDAARGAQLYMVCSACHGTDGRGSHELHTPSLVGQYDWYIARQLAHFRAGLRGVNPSDVYGRQMAPIASARSRARQSSRRKLPADKGRGPLQNR